MTDSRSSSGSHEQGWGPGDDLPRRVLDSLLEGCQVIGRDFRYLYVNEAVAEHGRTTREALVGRTMMEAYPGIERTEVFAALRRCLADRSPVQMENEFTYPDGTKGWFELKLEPVPEGVAILSVDITERKRAEAALARSRRALEVLSGCNQTLVRATDELRFLEDVCRIVVERGGYRLAWIGLKDGDEARTVRPAARAGQDEGYVDSREGTWDETELGAGPLGRAVRTGRPVVSRCIASDPELAPWREAALARGFASCLALPIRSDGEVLGALAIYSAEPDAFDDAERALLAEMALDLGFGVTTLRARVAHEHADARVRHLNAVLKGIRSINQLITRERDPQALIRQSCELLVGSRGYLTSCIVLCDGERILSSAEAGEEGKLRALRRTLAGGRLPECALTALHQPDVVVRGDPATTCRACPVNEDYSAGRDAAAIRLESEGRTLGVLLVALPSGAVDDPEELELLREVAGDVAFALRSIELQRERDDATEHLRAADEQLGAIVQAAPAAIFSFDEGGRVTTWNAGAERLFGWSAEETVGRPVPIIPDDRRTEHEELKRRILAGESFSELEVERLRKDGTTAWVSVSTAPLRNEEGRATGVMAVVVDIEQRKQTERERELVASFLSLVNDCKATRELIERSVAFFREELSFEAVGVRLQDGEDFPYYETSGFPQEFVELERSLCRRDHDGSVVRDGDQHPALDCMCGNVIRGRADPAKPFFTEAGSFWSNDTTRLLATTTDAERLTRTRNRCNAEGYESVGLFPLRSSSGCLGLLQLNDTRPGRFDPEKLALVERLSGHLAVALAKTRTDEDLARSEARFRSLLDAVSEVVWAAKPDGSEYSYLSPSASRIFGRPLEELLANPAFWLEVIHPEDRDRVSRHTAKLLDEGQIEDVYRILRPDGAIRWLQDRKTMVRDGSGRPLQIGGIATDITAQVEARAALEESEHRYRSLFENASEGIAYCRMIYDGERPVDFVYLDVNPAFETLTGLKDVVGKPVSQVIPGITESDWGLLQVYGRTARTGTPDRLEFFLEALGEWFGISVYSPKVDHFVAVFDVITARKRAEASLVSFSQRLERLAEVVQDLSQARSVAAIVDIVRHAARALAGSDGATFVLRDGDLCHYVDEDAIAPLWKGKRFPMSACISGWAMLHREAAAIDDIYADERIPHDAYRVTFVRSLVMVPIRRRSPIGAIGAYWASRYQATPEDVRILQALADSTSVAMENVRILEELEEGKQRTRAIYDHLPHATYVWKHMDGGFVLADLNEAARHAAKERWSALIGEPPLAFGQAFSGLEEDLRTCFERQVTVRREVDSILPGLGAPRRLVLTYGYIPSDMVILHTEDVTEQRQTEEQLKLSQRLEAVGQLAGGVAHDFNNLLTVINSYAALAMDALPEADPVRADLGEIRDAGRRAASLTRQLLAFGRKQILEPKVLDLNTVLRGVEGMLRRLLSEDIDIAVHLAEDLGSVEADPGQLEQVVINLAVNARDAMPQGGKLTIDTANADLDEAYASQHVSVLPGRYVQLAVTDTGHGIDAETRKHIFEPFFTTKEKGKGTGLGLSTVYGIVKQSGGNVWVYSEPGRGTTFKVYLPRKDAPAAELPRRPLAKVFHGVETVLVVEDEEEVRKLVERILRLAGYRVLSAANGTDALRLVRDLQGRVDLLLTDVVMPEMSGHALAERLTERDPKLRTLYMSGYTDNAIVHHGVLDPGTRFIGKPFAPGDLTRKVREVLDEEER